MTSKKTILVTGVNSGIGKALAMRLRDSTYNVVATCRAASFESCREAGFVDTESFKLLELDVTQQDQRLAVVSRANELFGGVDILINNAGISFRSTLEDLSDENNQLQLATNYLGPISLMKLVVPHMRKQRWGRIVNVSSVGGMMAMPTMGAYSASKFALEGASESFWYEVKPWGIAVSLVQPGFIRSESFKKVIYGANVADSTVAPGPYTTCYKEMSAFIEKCMNRAFATPESVAGKIIGLLENENPPLRLPATLDAHFFTFLRRVLPRGVYHSLLYRNLPGIKNWGKD